MHYKSPAFIPITGQQETSDLIAPFLCLFFDAHLSRFFADVEKIYLLVSTPSQLLTSCAVSVISLAPLLGGRKHLILLSTSSVYFLTHACLHPLLMLSKSICYSLSSFSSYSPHVQYHVDHVCTWSTSGASAPLRGRSTCGVSALGRGESTFGSTAPEPGNDFLLYIGEKIFCARARRIHLWIYRARARKRFSSLYRGEKFLRSGAENPPLDLPRPERGNDFLLYIGEKNFLRSGAENPPLDLPRPGAETIFFSI